MRTTTEGSIDGKQEGGVGHGGSMRDLCDEEEWSSTRILTCTCKTESIK
jgi:hypothetical protein